MANLNGCQSSGDAATLVIKPIYLDGTIGEFYKSFDLSGPGTLRMTGFQYMVTNNIAGLVGRLQYGAVGGCCIADDAYTSSASMEVNCLRAWSETTEITLPYKRTVTPTNLRETMKFLKYTTSVPVKIRVVIRLDYWTKVRNLYGIQGWAPGAELVGWAEGANYNQYLPQSPVEWSTVDDVVVHTRYFDLQPGTYIFAFEGGAWSYPFSSDPNDLAKIPWPQEVLGEYEFSEVLPPGLVLQSAPGNHPNQDLPGVLPDPPAPFDLLHFRLSLPAAATSAVEVRELGVMLDGKPELGDFATATLHEDPTCSGGAGAPLASAAIRGLSTYETVFLTLVPTQVIQPGQERCYTVQVEPKVESTEVVYEGESQGIGAFERSEGKGRGLRRA